MKKPAPSGIAMLQGGPIPRSMWADDRTGLILRASQTEETFFAGQKTEAMPMLFLFARDPGEETPSMTILADTRGEVFKDAFPQIIEAAATSENFVGAMQVTEGYMTSLTGKATRSNTRKESLIVTLFERKGVLQLRVSPFHRDANPGLPIRDGETTVHEGHGVAGRMVPKL